MWTKIYLFNIMGSAFTHILFFNEHGERFVDDPKKIEVTARMQTEIVRNREASKTGWVTISFFPICPRTSKLESKGCLSLNFACPNVY